MQIKQFVVGDVATNCYLVWDEKSHEGAIVDPGDCAEQLIQTIQEDHVQLKYILLTHAHFDHIGALDAVLNETGARCYVNRKEIGTNLAGIGHPFQAPEGAVLYGEGDEVKVGALTFRVIETPGHTPGGVTLICEDSLFTGDTLFRLSCGRTDFPGGDMNVELASLKKIASLPGDYDVYPGHAESSRLSIEREHNPYMRHAIEHL